MREKSPPYFFVSSSRSTEAWLFSGVLLAVSKVAGPRPTPARS